MDTRINKSINKLIKQKQKLLNEKALIENELADINSVLKKLHSFQSEQDKLQSAINDFYQPKKSINNEWHSASVLCTSKHWICTGKFAC